MILDIPSLLRRLVPDLLNSAHPSIAYVRATRPVFLVFTVDPNRPTCVVHIGTRESVERSYGNLARLYTHDPDLVPAPVAIGPCAQNQYAAIVSGLPGVPWFRLSERLKRAQDWHTLSLRGLDALDRLHMAIEQIPQWRAYIRPGDELRQRLARCLQQHGFVPDVVVEQSALEAATVLDSLGQLPAHWQHGDFCVNNLLISEDCVRVLDFEELGLTSMPLHDQLGLALSVYELGRDAGVLRELPRDHVDACTRQARTCADFNSRVLSGLLWHHLFYRIEQCLNSPLRSARLQSLLKLLRWFARAPNDFVPRI